MGDYFFRLGQKYQKLREIGNAGSIELIFHFIWKNSFRTIAPTADDGAFIIFTATTAIPMKCRAYVGGRQSFYWEGKKTGD
ncbi:hypothetical protein SAMN04488057_12172 [Cyclobacterium lianum]|uniref:Uncharacterized protein n=1 Tax=Cyclobacterium lianum TaxID=388280 RepID=A0A1M7QPS5_9BACT|nr:hypothetical protein SAMN04488057_12172 [Cyclobacterium lianum]